MEWPYMPDIAIKLKKKKRKKLSLGNLDTSPRPWGHSEASLALSTLPQGPPSLCLWLRTPLRPSPGPTAPHNPILPSHGSCRARPQQPSQPTPGFPHPAGSSPSATGWHPRLASPWPQEAPDPLGRGQPNLPSQPEKQPLALREPAAPQCTDTYWLAKSYTYHLSPSSHQFVCLSKRLELAFQTVNSSHQVSPHGPPLHGTVGFHTLYKFILSRSINGVFTAKEV